MRVKLLLNCQSYSPDKFPKHLLVEGFTSETVFYLTIGKEYEVFGIAGWQYTSYYCIVNDLDLPDWIPSDFFEVIDERLPTDWVMTEIDDELKYLQGSPVILKDEDYYNELVQHEPDAVSRFWNYANTQRADSYT